MLINQDRLKKSLHNIKNLKIKKTRKSFYSIKKPKNLPKPKKLFKSKIKQIKNNIKASKIKKIEKSRSKDYYKPIKTIDSFDNKKNKYIEY